VIKAES